MFKYYFSKTNRLNGLSVLQSGQDALGHPQRPRQAQPWRVQQEPLMFLKDKSIQNSPKVTMGLSDTLSDVVMVNYGKYSKYKLGSS